MAANQQNRKVITSFMLRFVRETEVEVENSGTYVTAAPSGANPPGWRGVIKHIQSGAEQHFTTLVEAETFMKKYIEE